MGADNETARPSHSDLSLALTSMLARVAKRSLEAQGVQPAATVPLAESVTEDLAYVFDGGGIRVNGKLYRPTVQFIGDDGAPVPTEQFPLHGYARDALKFDKD